MALAQGDLADNERAARAHFGRGRAAYDRGDFEVALDAFQAAYAIAQHPKLLYNIGLSSQKLGLVTEAITAFDGYLAWGEGDRGEEVRGRLAALRDLAHRDATFAAPPPLTVAVTAAQESAPAKVPVRPDRPSEHAETGARKWWPWALVGGVVAAAIAVAVAVPIARRDGADPERVAPNTGLSIDALRWSR